MMNQDILDLRAALCESQRELTKAMLHASTLDRLDLMEELLQVKQNLGKTEDKVLTLWVHEAFTSHKSPLGGAQ